MREILSSRRALAFMIAYFLTSATLEAQIEDLNLRWDELGPVISGERIAIPVEDGPRIEGTVLAVRDAGIEMEIRETTDDGAYPEGRALVDRDSISSIELITDTLRWRWIGAGIGLTGATVLSALAITGPSGTDSDSRNLAAVLVNFSGGALGYFLGPPEGPKRHEYFRCYRQRQPIAAWRGGDNSI